MLARLVASVRGSARRRIINTELDEELRFHLEQEIEAHVSRGPGLPVNPRRAWYSEPAPRAFRCVHLSRRS